MNPNRVLRYVVGLIVMGVYAGVLYVEITMGRLPVLQAIMPLALVIATLAVCYTIYAELSRPTTLPDGGETR